MADIKELLQKAAAHLRSATGVNDYPLSIKLDDAAESLGEPVAWAFVNGHRLYCVTTLKEVVDEWRNDGEDVRPLYLAPQPAVPEGWREAILRVRESVCAGGSGSFMQSERIIAETYLDAVEEEIELLAAAFPNGEAGDKP